ncbi:MAG: hypothetical protein JSS02_29090, partial [Planctomycetes bacterium]|nr:hypothetical protein [Planctomycetota bacterium]
MTDELLIFLLIVGFGTALFIPICTLVVVLKLRREQTERLQQFRKELLGLRGDIKSLKTRESVVLAPAPITPAPSTEMQPAPVQPTTGQPTTPQPAQEIPTETVPTPVPD